MKRKIQYSIFVASLITFCGCTPINVNTVDTNTKPSANSVDEIKSKSKVELKRSFNIQSGDNAKTIFERLGSIDNNIYILENGINFSSKFAVNNIENIQALEKYFLANDYILHIAQVEGSNYVKINLYQESTLAEKKLKDTSVSISGNVPVGDVINMLSQKAKVTPVWEDKTANNLALINRNYNFNGNALEAINHVANGADLSVNYKEDKVFVSYFRTETMSLDIFTRDRNTNTDINIEMRTPGENENGSTNGSNNNNTNSTTKDLSVKYKTALVKDLQNSIDSVLSKQGSYTFIPASGQILVRDKNENVKLVQKLVSDFNSKFKDTIEITLTLYKVTKEKGDTRGIDFKALGSKFDFNATNMVSTAFSGNTSGNSFGVGYTNGNDNAVLNFLREQGDAEVLNPISFETQSNILKTVKIANNYGYISSIKTTSDTNTGTTASVNPSSVADGGFISAITKVIDNQTIAIDLYSTTTSLSRFNNVTAFGNSVQTPDTAEQSIDGYHRVKVGVPYILVSHKYEENKNNSAGLPVEIFDSVGLKADKSKDVYIVIALEAKIRK